MEFLNYFFVGFLIAAPSSPALNSTHTVISEPSQDQLQAAVKAHSEEVGRFARKLASERGVPGPPYQAPWIIEKKSCRFVPPGSRLVICQGLASIGNSKIKTMYDLKVELSAGGQWTLLGIMPEKGPAYVSLGVNTGKMGTSVARRP